jgi:hypothetical protein
MSSEVKERHETITEFLTKVSEDPSLQERFKQDPDAVLRGEGFSSEEIAAIKSGKVSEIQKLYPVKAKGIVVVVVVAARAR